MIRAHSSDQSVVLQSICNTKNETYMGKKIVTSNAAVPAKAPAIAKAPAKPATKSPAVVEAPAAKAAQPVAPAPVAAPAAPKKSAAKPKVAGEGAAVSSNDIALRAYFIAENRRLQGFPGDESQDWLEAERQIAAERGSTQKSSKR